MNRKILNQSIISVFSTITIGILTLLTYKTEYGVFLIASLVLLWFYYTVILKVHLLNLKIFSLVTLLTALVGIIFLNLVPLPLYVLIPIAVGTGVGLMILLNVTHPPAGGNPIIVIMGSVSLDYIINPIIVGSLIILFFGIVLNRLILKKKYPL